ncbi:MAG: hypothetical protein QHG99_00660 [Methanomicrobiales archaeon]|nr:hypothetical protein [Methanomicrobiales archaeon]
MAGEKTGEGTICHAGDEPAGDPDAGLRYVSSAITLCRPLICATPVSILLPVCISLERGMPCCIGIGKSFF